MDKQKELEEVKKLLEMLNSVQSGKIVTCPVCGEGILEDKGPRVMCSNKKCNVIYTID